MGQESSSPIQLTKVLNQNARCFFESFLEVQQYIPEKKKKSNKTLVKIIYESLKRNPSSTEDFGLAVIGKKMGPVFVNFYIPHLIFPETLTKISLRKCSLKGTHVKYISKLILTLPNLQQFDSSENDFGDKNKELIDAAVDHPSLQALILENTKINDASVASLNNLIRNNRKLESLLVAPLKVTKSNLNLLTSSLFLNNYLKCVSFKSQDNDPSISIAARNCFISDLVDSISRYPFQSNFREKVESFKSVKGRQMAVGRQEQKERIRGTKLFESIELADLRASTIDKQETRQTSDTFRSGQAEMIGRRPKMEDVSIVLNDTPSIGSMLFGLFDGHGGREASEYASENLPSLISDNILSGKTLRESIEEAFTQLQNDMRQWCIYVGTTVAIAIVDEQSLSVANLGDTRCVLCRDGKAVRLTVDHKPDLPDEMEYIQSKGGFVKEGRLGGLLSVSRALGDGLLGDALNTKPSFRQVEITENDMFMILACDGVWDVISDQEACDIVAAEIEPLTAAKKLRDMAFEKNSLDNISVIVVFLAEALANKVLEE
ncbi:protein phosphatase 2C [Histomonas meleagridis]|uniref:protein phosphatase 2C n=1 Tax=Histomonas meleagridis TaxID=135588 RepID=UPI003559A5AC|nr:protein phosphatase 2C [Histomonas meleagridis]KAH0806655.1 protein phosphatase 2C [Histomonas meleagridis]